MKVWEAAIAPVHATDPADNLTRDRKIRSPSHAEKRCHLRRRRDSLVHGSQKPRRWRTGNAPAPGIFVLSGYGDIVGIGVGQRVARRNVQQQERIEGDAQVAGFDLLDGLDNRGIRGRAAIGQLAV